MYDEYDDEEVSYHPNWGGKREGAGRKMEYKPDCDMDIRKPKSIYCSDSEIGYLKAFLPYLRRYRELLNHEPVAGHEEVYDGTHEEWEQEFEKEKSRLTYDNLSKNLK